MESPEDIEKALGRLVPAAFSAQGQRALENTIEGLSLAGPVPVVAQAPRSGWWTAAVAVPTAAAAALAVALFMSKGEGVAEGPAEIAGTRQANPEQVDAVAVNTAPKRQAFVRGDVPTRRLDTAQSRGSFLLPNGEVNVELGDQGDVFFITAPDGHEIFRGPIDSAGFPKEFKAQAEALRNGLRGAIENQQLGHPGEQN